MRAAASRAVETTPSRRIDGAVVSSIAIVAVVATAATIGADARWLAALGQAIVSNGAIPHGVPYAAATSSGWANVPVLAELTFHWLAGFGDRGFLTAQVVAVAGALTLLTADMRRAGARDVGAALVLLAVAVGAASALFVIRVQLFSLPLFALLALLLRSEARSPSRRAWFVPLILCLWSNLHGAVLVGLALTLIYLVVGRARREPRQAAMIGVASLLAVCVTPALERTPSYYLGVLHNEAARRGEGLWAPLSLSSGIDIALVGVAVVLIALALRSRPPLWELLALAALALLTIRTARSGVWLLFFAAPPAAVGIRTSWSLPRKWAVSLAAGLGLVVIYGVARDAQPSPVSQPLIRETLVKADGTPVLADSIDAERLALAGGKVWMSNPLDAFPHRDQRVYLDWLEGRPTGAEALTHAGRAVLVRRGSGADTLTAKSDAFRVAAADGAAVLYVRRR